MGRPPQAVNEIVNGKKTLTEETALELERVLDTPASVWVKLEANYQLALARRAEVRDLDRQAKWLDHFPVHQMEQRGWIEAKTARADKVRALLRFFGVASFDTWDEHQQALGFRITGRAKIDTGALAAWVRRGEIEGAGTATSRYDEQPFRDVLNLARGLTTKAPESAWPDLRQACASAGVAAVVIPELPKIGANGVARWLTPNKALIQLNLRYRWADIFWFTFFHEAAHVLMHDTRKAFVEIEGNPGRDPQEPEADRVAEELLIPSDEWEQFVLQSDFDAKSVAAFADDIGIHPGIVVGRLQHLGLVPWGSTLNALRSRLAWAHGD
jgi:Plasmid maintenance system antidote protein